MNTTTEPRAVKTRARKKPVRTIRLLPALEAGTVSIAITVGRKTAEYGVAPLPTDMGQAFQLRKLDAEEGDPYSVLLSADGRHSCECMGFLRHGRQNDGRSCKHIDGLLALQRAGKLPTAPKPVQRFRSTGDVYANAPESVPDMEAGWNAAEYAAWSQSLPCVACGDAVNACECQQKPAPAKCPGCGQRANVGLRTCGRYACVEAFEFATADNPAAA
jgi:hypothetical protein